jgi:4-carboxymuconolactone decarboxylase
MATTQTASSTRLEAFDDATRILIQTAAVVATGSESDVRAILARAQVGVPHIWIEELLLQTYLFAGFPRTLNALREWRRLVPTPAENAEIISDAGEWERRGRETCKRVYGAMYDRLRHNIDGLHPAIDAWMIVEGYGKVLSRPGLDLGRRELCIVAACVASGQERQLHSHLHGALNVGVSAGVVRGALDELRGVVSPALLEPAKLLFARVAGK